VPAHKSVTENATLSGAYAWKSAKYQVTGWLPVSCEVSLR
jgi:hypothetical protein